MTPGGPGSNNGLSISKKKSQANGGKINHQDQMEDKNHLKKTRKQNASDDEEPRQGSRETSR